MLAEQISRKRPNGANRPVAIADHLARPNRGCVRKPFWRSRHSAAHSCRSRRQSYRQTIREFALPFHTTSGRHYGRGINFLRWPRSSPASAIARQTFASLAATPLVAIDRRFFSGLLRATDKSAPKYEGARRGNQAITAAHQRKHFAAPAKHASQVHQRRQC